MKNKRIGAAILCMALIAGLSVNEARLAYAEENEDAIISQEDASDVVDNIKESERYFDLEEISEDNIDTACGMIDIKTTDDVRGSVSIE